MKRGHKKCPNCFAEDVAARCLRCPNCNYEFPRPKPPDTDWRALQPGEKIKSLRGYGPFYDGKDKRTFTGHYGSLFIVQEICEDGLKVLDRSTVLFLYMGPECPSSTGVGMLSPHAIEVVKPKFKRKKK